WKESIRNENDGLYHVPAEDWDSETLLCVLPVLHFRNGQVPRTVSLEMLAKIAVLIDFYECAEALESFTERWIEHLQVATPVSSYFFRGPMLWMCIDWVLRLPQEFLWLRIINFRPSNHAIGTVFSQLRDLLEEFRSPLYRCLRGDSFECGSILYGALFREMELQGLLPIPTAPYSGLRVSELYSKMQRIRSPVWCRP
ncbi:hypothetical protein GQ44DRAFT_599689, partial [Phaeosphaeriaceae sp. PMI808]